MHRTSTTWHKSQVFGYILLAFLGGVFFSSFLPVSRTVELVMILAAIFIIAVASYHGTFKDDKRGVYRRKFSVLVGVLILFFAFGIIRFNMFVSEKSFLKELSDRQAGGRDVEVIMLGYVDGEVTSNGERNNFPFKVKQVVVSGRHFPTDERIMVFAKPFPKYSVGEKLLLKGAPKIPQNFDTFDYVTYLKKDGIRVLVSYPEITSGAAVDLSMVESTKLAVFKKIFSIKDSFESAVEKSLPEPNASFISGILLGSRQNISQELKDAFSRTGTSHIMAISGYNITILANIILWALVFWFRRRQAFWISVAVIIAFTILTGASSSVVRASIMGLIYLFATGFGRLYDPRNSILLTGGIMVAINPMTLVFDIGFQLSFLAVMGLILIVPILEAKAKNLPKLGGIKEIFLMTLAAQIAVAPLLIYYFKTFSIFSLPANLLILPLIPAAMLLGFITGVLGWIFLPLGQVAGSAAWALSTFQIGVVRLFSEFKFSSLSVSINWYILVILYILLTLLVYVFRKPKTAAS